MLFLHSLYSEVVLVTIQLKHTYKLLKVMHYKIYNTICGIVSYNLSLRLPIKIYKQFILIMNLHRFGTKNELFIHFCKLVTFHLNLKEKLRNRTNHGIVVFLFYIGLYILLSIYLCRSG